MSYPWHMFTVWFADGYDGVYQATGIDVFEAIKELMDGFASNPEMARDPRAHGDVMKIQFEKQMTIDADKAQRALEIARSMQKDIDRIVKREEIDYEQ